MDQNKFSALVIMMPYPIYCLYII